MTAKWLLIGFIVAECSGYGSGGLAEKGPPGDPGPARSSPQIHEHDIGLLTNARSDCTASTILVGGAP
jgi:hypothetical protein